MLPGQDIVIGMEWTSKAAQSDLLKNWANPLSPIAFQGCSKLFKYYGGRLKHSQIQKILSQFESFSIMRQEHSSKNTKYQGFNFPTHIWNLCEVDSFSVQELAEDNMGIQHLMCIVNNFSKMAFVAVMRDRSSRAGLEAISSIFSLVGVYPDALISDKVIYFQVNFSTKQNKH